MTWIITLYFFMWHLLVMMAVLFIISGVDDLLTDIWYWIRYFIRLTKKKRYPALRYEQLASKKEQWIAILVPCWHEAGVIGTMLKNNCFAIDYQSYVIFVGVYPNDPETQSEVQMVSKSLSQVYCVVGENPGPTNKASNLNQIYLESKKYEQKHGISFEIFLFHDAEDIIHPLSLKLYNYLIPRKDMIQIPVFPLVVNYLNFTHWLYADEFSENHTKDIVVRESMNTHIPSAGVGTAFSKKALQILEEPDTKAPFSTMALTEDYRTSLMIRIHKLRSIFVTQSVLRTRWVAKRDWLFRKKYQLKTVREYVATRALFPKQYYLSVRQKTRWVIGIVFQEWEQTRWPKEWRIRFSLFRDRKAIVTHFINGFGYIIFAFWLVYSILTRNYLEYPTLHERFVAQPWVWWFIVIATIMMIERLIQRIIAVIRIYGWIPALLVIPRAFYGNILNLHAVIRAYRVYFAKKIVKKKASPSWDKTDHHFPGQHLLIAYKKRLGDLLLERGLINQSQLQQALEIQHQTGMRLGDILCQYYNLQSSYLQALLGHQYQLPLISLQDAQEKSLWPKKWRIWLKKNAVYLLSETEEKFLFAIHDPSNERMLSELMRKVAPKKTEFLLIS